MRSCLQMGLHRDTVDRNERGFLQTDLRRRVFWTAYCIGRAVCSALQRPLSIPDPAISTELLSGASDQTIAATGSGSDGSVTKTRALQWIEFSQLKSAMIEVQFQGKSLEDGQTLDTWLEQMELLLNDWGKKYSHLDEAGGNWPPGMSLSSAIARLHSPSPQMPVLLPNSLLVAFEATSVAARHQIEGLSSGLIHCPWIDARDMFQMGITLLFCIRNGYETICERFSLRDIVETTKIFTMYFLSAAEKGWSEILKYAGAYERLCGPLLETVFLSRGMEKPLTTAVSFDAISFNAIHDAELMRLLYPGPAQLDKLRFGRNRGPAPVVPDIRDRWDIFEASDIFPFLDTIQL